MSSASFGGFEQSNQYSLVDALTARKSAMLVSLFYHLTRFKCAELIFLEQFTQQILDLWCFRSRTPTATISLNVLMRVNRSSRLCTIRSNRNHPENRCTWFWQTHSNFDICNVVVRLPHCTVRQRANLIPRGQNIADNRKGKLRSKFSKNCCQE
jgi:hypothetical protein